MTADAAPLDDEAEDRAILSQPAGPFERFERVPFSWRGGGRGLDRPLGRAFVRVVRGRRTVDSDLGLGMLWKVDDQGEYRAFWEIPRDLEAGRYRLVATANRYRLASRRFRVVAARTLSPERSGSSVRLAYQSAVRDVDLRHRPAYASGGTIRFRLGGRTVTRRKRRGTVFRVPEGARILSARDRFGNHALQSSAP